VYRLDRIEGHVTARANVPTGPRHGVPLGCPLGQVMQSLFRSVVSQHIRSRRSRGRGCSWSRG
jgi:hypothetical protein